jgi:hypothetical protein
MAVIRSAPAVKAVTFVTLTSIRGFAAICSGNKKAARGRHFRATDNLRKRWRAFYLGLDYAEKMHRNRHT